MQPCVLPCLNTSKDGVCMSFGSGHPVLVLKNFCLLSSLHIHLYVISSSHRVLLQRACIFLCPQFECRKTFLRWYFSLGGLSLAPSLSGHRILGGVFLFLCVCFLGGVLLALFFFLSTFSACVPIIQQIFCLGIFTDTCLEWCLPAQIRGEHSCLKTNSKLNNAAVLLKRSILADLLRTQQRKQ